MRQHNPCSVTAAELSRCDSQKPFPQPKQQQQDRVQYSRAVSRFGLGLLAVVTLLNMNTRMRGVGALAPTAPLQRKTLLRMTSATSSSAGLLRSMNIPSVGRAVAGSRSALRCTNSRELRFFGNVNEPLDECRGAQQDPLRVALAPTVPHHHHQDGWLFDALAPQLVTSPSLAEVLQSGGEEPSAARTTTTATTATTTQTTASSFAASATTTVYQSTTTGRTTVSLGGASMATTSTIFRSFSSIQHKSSSNNNNNQQPTTPDAPRQGYGSSLALTEKERELFSLLRRVRKDTNLSTTLRVAGGWVRDKLLATPEFSAYHAVFGVAGKRLTSKFRASAASSSSLAQQVQGRVGSQVLSANEASCKPVDIDIALDDMLGREYAEHLNDYLRSQGEETHSVGVVLKNPEKSKHLETATMQVASFWIDFVNLRAEEYTQDSRIPDLMRIGTASEDAFRRDLTINALFYNINTGEVEDWTGRGFDDLRKGIVATPLPPLTTLLDDPLRVLRSIRFAARLRFTMDDELVQAAQDVRVRTALAQKVSRERIGNEVDLMLRSPDPVGAMRLLLQLHLVDTVFPQMPLGDSDRVAEQGLALLSTAHDHLADCKWSPPVWCNSGSPAPGLLLLRDEEARRLLWYTSFLKPLWDYYNKQDEENPSTPPRQRQSKKQKRKHSPVQQLLVDDLKRPTRDADAIAKILTAADEISELIQNGSVISATMILCSDIHIAQDESSEDADCASRQQRLRPFLNGRPVDPVTEEDSVWTHAMQFRLRCSRMLQRIGPLWRAALILSLSEQLNALQSSTDSLQYVIEGDVMDETREEERRGIIEQYDIFAASLLRLGLIGSNCWDMKPLLDGGAIKKILPRIPKGPSFREIMDEQSIWMITHPGAGPDALTLHLQGVFPDYAPEPENL